MSNIITTIQLRENVKMALESLKEKPGQSYEDVIVKLIDEKKMKKEELEKLLIEQCKEMYEEDIKVAKEWEGTLMDGLTDWEWDGSL